MIPDNRKQIRFRAYIVLIPMHWMTLTKNYGEMGTAQKIGEDGRYSDKKYVSSFVGFAPAEEPKIAVLVVIDEPEKQHYGGIVAAPAFRKIAQKTLDYINTSPKSIPNRIL